jgi:plasmid stabilization system protein ParE
VAARIYRTAKERLLEIWDYTERTWGEEQADKYVRNLIEAINRAYSARHKWRPISDNALIGVYFLRHQHHYIFFRELSSGGLGVINILHESMDIPARLKEDSGQEDKV